MSIFAQIMMLVTLRFGEPHQQLAEHIYDTHAYHVVSGIVIIDADEL